MAAGSAAPRAQGLGPPWPREHGAWVMLLAPLATGLVAAAPAEPVGALALTGAALTGFLGANAAAVALRPRAPRAAGAWGLAFLAAMLACSVPLLAGPGGAALLPLAAPVGVVGAWHLLVQRGPVRARLDRQAGGQLAAAAVLSLTGPAAWAVATGGLGLPALVTWLAFVLAFTSGILHVNMRLAAVGLRGPADAATRRRLGGAVAGFHGVLAGVALAAAWLPAGGALTAGLAPFVARGLVAYARLGPGKPSFKRIGFAEAGLVTWLAACLVWALRVP